MGQVVQLGQINTAALSVADVYVQIVPPQFLINGIPTNVVGMVGSASWGPVGAPSINTGYTDASALFGPMVPRKYDLMTPVWTATQQGGQAVLRLVRATDGNDSAASVNIQSGSITITSFYTGSYGNQQTVSIFAGSAVGTWKAVLSTPGRVPEVFDNISQGIASVSVTAGTGYTSVPSIVPTPAPAGGTNAVVNATLTVLANPVVTNGGTSGYSPGDKVTLANGLVLSVATAPGGVIGSVTINTNVLLTAGTIPVNPVAQTSTNGSGLGTPTFTLTWGLGAPSIVVPGTLYIAAPTLTVVGGGGSAGSYTASIGYWQNMANAINNGVSNIRGPSLAFTATAGTTSTTPTTTVYNLAGGADGANVGTSALIGVDSVPRKGMYALRGQTCSIAMVSDLDDWTSWSTQIAFGLSEGIYMIGTGPSGDTISNAITVKANGGVDSYSMKLMFGDWVYLLDTVNNLTRLVSPQGYVCGVLGNQAPNQSTLNKTMYGVVGTQKSFTKTVYASADLSALALAGIDVICNPIPRGASFGCRNGRNTSSNQVIHGDNYTRMTNFIAYTIAGAMGYYVGTLQTIDQQRQAKATLDFYLTNLQQQGLIGNSDGTTPFQTTLDASNNPQSRVALGYEQADVLVTFLSVVEFLIINIQGGQSVVIQRTTTSA